MSVLKRFPSYQHVLQSAVDSARRFPLALISALVATICAAILIEHDFDRPTHELEQLMMAAGMGIAWFVALALWGEKRRWSGGVRWGVQAAGLILLVGYFFSLPDNPTATEAPMIRFAVLVAGLHFLVASLPFLGKGQGAGFWQFNKTLLLRFLLAAFYSAAIFIGLAIALAAADHLFGADIDDETYGQLWVFVVGLFNTWFFLAGIPEDLNTLGDDDRYPVGLKVFTQFVLLPLVGLYFAILIAYEVKIIVEWNWPRGWVSELVLWYAVVGILSMLLLHPLREKVENRWIKVFTAWYFRVLVPLIIMLFLAIVRRTSDYGITESRYLVLAMAVGLAVVMIYFIFSRTKDIRIVPTILAALAFLSAYGPWGAFAVSERSQMGRLEKMLITNELLADGKTVPAASGEQPAEVGEMSNIVDYLCRRHGVEPFEVWLDDSTMAALDTVSHYELAGQVAKRLGFDYLPYAGFSGEGGYCHLTADLSPMTAISGFDYLIEVTSTPGIENRQAVDLGEYKGECWYDTAVSTFYFSLARDSVVEVGTLPLGEKTIGLAERQVGYRNVPPDSLSFDLDTKTYRARLMLNYLSGTLRNDTFKVDSYSGQLLIGVGP